MRWMTLRERRLSLLFRLSQGESHPDSSPASPALPEAHPETHTHTYLIYKGRSNF